MLRIRAVDPGVHDVDGWRAKLVCKGPPTYVVAPVAAGAVCAWSSVSQLVSKGEAYELRTEENVDERDDRVDSGEGAQQAENQPPFRREEGVNLRDQISGETSSRFVDCDRIKAAWELLKC